MLIPFSDYPVRPQLEQGESLFGYVYRFYTANGYRIPEVVRKWLFTLLYRRDNDKSDTFNRLHSLSGSTIELERIWWIRTRSVPWSDMQPKQEIWITSSQSPLRFCPICLKETDFHSALWEIDFVSVCPVHNCNLVVRCPNCLSKLHWQSLLSDWRCKCRTPLTSMSGDSATINEIRITRSIAPAKYFELPINFQNLLGGPVDPRFLIQYLNQYKSNR